MVHALSIYEFKAEDAERFAREQGIKIRRRGNEIMFAVCPYCRNRTNDKNTFAINAETGQFKCLRESCGAHGNMIVLAKDFGFSLGRDVDEYYNQSRRYRRIHRKKRAETKPAAVVYMESRGISKDITEKYGLTTQNDKDNILVFPFYDENNIMQFVKYRKTDFDKEKDKNKEWCEADCKPILFGMDQCKNTDAPLVLTEGQIDSLSVAEAGIENAVSVPTGAKGFTWVPYCWDFMAKFETLIVFGDHENDQITLLDEMRKRFHGTVKHVRPEDYRGCKDANDILRKYGKEAVRQAVLNAIPAENPRIIRVADVKRRDFSALEHFSTGISSLNRLTGGFYLGQLIVLTGERGDGKSTLASQFGVFAMMEGYNTFFYSGELEDWYFRAWLERQITGDRELNRIRDRDGNINYSVNRMIESQMTAWYRDKAYLYCNDIIQENETEEQSLIKVMESAIKQYECRVLIVDNLMTAMEDDLSSDIYRQQTVFVKKLTKMAKQYGVLIILVAHPKKRDGYEFSNDSVAGSSNITNLCDVVMRYTRPQERKRKNADEDENETEDGPRKPDRLLQVTKNRLTGKLSFDGIGLYFQESSKRISENPETFDWECGWEDFHEVNYEELPFGDPEE